MSGFTIFAIMLVILAVYGVLTAAVMAPQGFNYAVEGFGRYARALRPGLAIILHFLDRIGHRVNVMERFINGPE